MKHTKTARQVIRRVRTAFPEAAAFPTKLRAVSHHPGARTSQLTLLKGSKTVQADQVTGLDYALWLGDVGAFLKELPNEPLFDFVVTSPPYNIGKQYETRVGLEKYLQWQEGIINELVPRLKKGGSLCWQVGNYVDDNQIFPLDIEFAPIFKKHQLQLRNRII